MILRKTASLTALLSFILMVATSVVLYVAPFGRHSGQWRWLGLYKSDWQALHVNLGLLFLAAGVVHIVINLKPILHYLKNRERKMRIFTLQFNLALLLTAWMTASTLYDWPPVSLIQRYRESRKHLMDRPRHQEPGEPDNSVQTEQRSFRFGRTTLAEACGELGLDTKGAVAELRRLGMKARADWTIKKIADANGTQPHRIYETLTGLADR